MQTKKKAGAAGKTVKKEAAKTTSAGKTKSARTRATTARTKANAERSRTKKPARPLAKVAAKKPGIKTKADPKTSGSAKRRGNGAGSANGTAKLDGKKASVGAQKGSGSPKTRAARVARRAPAIPRKTATKARDVTATNENSTTRERDRRGGLPLKEAEVESTPELEVTPISDTTNEPQSVHLESTRDSMRGAHSDLRSHSNPQVQLLRQHVQTMRSPERRHTMRGH